MVQADRVCTRRWTCPSCKRVAEPACVFSESCSLLLGWKSEQLVFARGSKYLLFATSGAGQTKWGHSSFRMMRCFVHLSVESSFHSVQHPSSTTCLYYIIFNHTKSHFDAYSSLFKARGVLKLIKVCHLLVFSLDLLFLLKSSILFIVSSSSFL